MKKILTLTACLFACVSSANASVIINPNTGWNGYFAWNSVPGQIDNISTTEYPSSTGPNVDWKINVATDSVMSFASAWDDYIPGDVFSLHMDGSQYAWTTSYIDSHNYFHGEYLDLFLSAGTHLITFFVEPGSLSIGAGHVSFSSVSAAPVNVPEPSLSMLLGLGLIALAVKNKKKIA